MSKLFIALGGINALIAVTLGAAAAHALKPRLTTEMLTVFNTGVHYQGYHALGLILIGILSHRLPRSRVLIGSGWAMLLGIVLFSGSLYGLSLSGLRGLGMITPFGGAAFLLGWLLLVIAVLRSQQ